MAESDTGLYSEEVSLRKAVKDVGFVFPVVLRTKGSAEDYEVIDGELNNHIPENSLLLLEAQVNIIYAHVKVLALENEADVVKTKGQEYADEYNKMVDQEFLIPNKFPKKVKVVHRPGKRRRYAAISDVIQNLPRFLKVETDTEATELSTGKIETVPKGIFLEVVKVLQDTERYMECKGSNKKWYRFGSNDVVNFTALDDNKSYTLSEVTSQRLLPAFVKFVDCVSPDDVVVFDDDLASKTMMMTFGPFEVIQTKRKYSLVGWIRLNDHGIVSLRRVLLPIAMWDNELVKIRQFRTNEDRDVYLHRKFPTCDSSSDYHDKLYIVPVEFNKITYLSGGQQLHVDSEDESSEESDGYEEPMTGPAVPPRRPRVGIPQKPVDDTAIYSEEILLPQRAIRPDVLQKLMEKVKLGFGLVHRELKHGFTVKERAKESPKPDKAPYTSSEPRKVLHHPPAMPSATKIYSQSTNTMRRKEQEASPSQVLRTKPSPLPKPKPRVPVPGEDGVFTDNEKTPTVPSKLSRLSTKSYSESAVYEIGEDKETDFGPTPARTKSVSCVSDAVASDEIEERQIRDRPPLPIPEKDVDEGSLEYDYPNIPNVMQGLVVNASSPNKPLYQRLTVAEVQTITRQNQTARDFCKYSVKQVCECFALCAMEKLGEVCMKNKVDGAFLAGYEIELLRKEPFMLSDFEIKKVQMIIQQGWRPMVDSA